MKPVRIGMIGYGSIGRVHALAYRAIPFYYGLPAGTVQVVAVATRSAATAEAAAREIGCESWSADYHELLARPDIDVIDCCTPQDSHEAIMIAAAAAGKQLYCEKPLARTPDEAARIAAAAAQAGVRTQMTFHYRFFPGLQRAAQIIREGHLGRIYSFRGRYYRSSYTDPNKAMSWKLRRAEGGGGALIDLGSHVLDSLYMLVGRFAAALGSTHTLIPQRPLKSGSTEMGTVDVDDIAFAHLRAQSGAVGLLEVSRLATGATNAFEIEVFGEHASLHFTADAGGWLDFYDARDPDSPIGGVRGWRRVETLSRFEGARAPDWSQPPDFVRAHAECQYQFLKALDEGRTPAPDFADGLHIQAVIDAIERSAAQSRWADVVDYPEESR